MKNLIKISSILLAAAIVAGCSNDEPNGKLDGSDDVQVKAELNLTDAESRAASAMHAFNDDFFKAACAQAEPGQNVVVSPVSASILLSMVANAAGDDAAAEILRAIGTDNLSTLNSLSSKYLSALPTVDEAVTMKFANALWYQQGHNMSPSVADVYKSLYKADTFEAQLQTNDPRVIAQINGWVENSTEGLIKNIISDLDPSTVALLADAFYFRGKWTEPFEAEETSSKRFEGVSGTSTVDMMHRTGTQLYTQGDGYQAVKMEMGKNNAFEAIFILPAEGVNINDFVAASDFNSIASASFYPERLDFSLPRFKTEPNSRVALDDALRALGINKMMDIHSLKLFTEKVDSYFSVFQKCALEFDESGAEGAAVTWSEICTSPGPGYEPEIIVVAFDRPFVFMVNECTTGACLFAGKVAGL